MARLVDLLSPVDSRAMSRDTLVTSMPSRAWSCETLNEGIQKCANMAGLHLKPQELEQASQHWCVDWCMDSTCLFIFV